MNRAIYLIGVAVALFMVANASRAEAPQTLFWSDDSDNGSFSMEDANVAAFLAMIRAAEGTAMPEGYYAMFGYPHIPGRLLDSLDDHPRQRFPFTDTNGKTDYTTAAGAYQFIAPTWDRIATKLSLSDFGPESQDAAAVELIREKGALDDVRAGRFDDAVRKVSPVWASLPNATYPQRRRSVAFVRSAYENAGGSYA